MRELVGLQHSRPPGVARRWRETHITSGLYPPLSSQCYPVPVFFFRGLLSDAVVDSAKTSTAMGRYPRDRIKIRSVASDDHGRGGLVVAPASERVEAPVTLKVSKVLQLVDLSLLMTYLGIFNVRIRSICRRPLRLRLRLH